MLFIAVPLFMLAAIGCIFLFLMAEKRPEVFTRPLDIAGYVSVPVVLTVLLLAGLAGIGNSTGLAWLMVVVMSTRGVMALILVVAFMLAARLALRKFKPGQA